MKGIIAQYTEELKGIFDKRLQLEVEKNKIESTLNDNLRRKRDELSQQLKEVSTDDKQLLLTESAAQLKIIEEKIMQNQTNLDEQKNKLQISIEEVYIYLFYHNCYLKFIVFNNFHGFNYF